MKVGIFIGRFLPIHKEHYRAIMKAGAMVDKLYVIVNTNEEEDKKLCLDSKIPYIPPKKKLSFVKKAFHSIGHIDVVGINYKDNSYLYSDEYKDEVVRKIGSDFDVVLSTAPIPKDICNDIFKDKITNIHYDEKQEIVTSMDIRNEPFKYWEYLLGHTRELFAKKVCIIGPESVGKSTLVKSLSKIYNTSWISETGGDFYRYNYGSYQDVARESDFITIVSEHQTKFEKALKTANKLFFADTDVITTQYYFMDEYGRKNPFAEGLIESGAQDFHLYIFLEPFDDENYYEDDGVRYSNTRELVEESKRKIKELYCDYGKELVFVGGSRVDRMIKITELCDNLIR